MKALLRNILALSLLTLTLTACESDDWRLEREIVGSWLWYYEDYGVYEEETYTFTENGKWSYLYIYEDAFGRYQSEVDGGYYTISYEVLYLHSNFDNNSYSYDIDIHGKRMYLGYDNGEVEYLRIR